MSVHLIHAAPKGGEVFSLANDVCRLLATGAQTNGVYTLLESHVPPGGGTPPHVHRREDESFFVLEGEVTFYVGGKKIVAPAGSFLQAPRDIPHHFKNESRVPARMLTYVMPAGFENFMREVGRPLPSVDAAPFPFGPADIEKLLAVAPKYGIEILPPPQ